MPKTRPLTKAQKVLQEEEAASEAFVRKLNMIKMGVSSHSDEDFADMIGVTFSRYRNIKRNPMSVRLSELMKILRLGETCGMVMQMDSHGQLNAKA